MTYLLAATLSTLSLYLYEIQFRSYKISLAGLICAAIILITFLKINKKIIGYFLFIFVIIWFNALLNVVDIDSSYFIKTYIMMSAAIYLLLWSAYGSNFENLSIDYNKVSNIVISTSVGYALFQILEYQIQGTTESWHWLDKYSISIADNAERFQAVNLLFYIRPVSLYYEPSFYATVLYILLNIKLINNKKDYFVLICIIGIMLSLSMTVIIIMMLQYIFSIRKNYKSLLIIASTVSISLIYFFKDVNLDELLRYREVLNAGTSGHERLIVPMLAVADNLIYSPTGIALGQLGFVMNNSVAYFILYFGILSPIIFYLLFKKFLINNKYSINYFFCLSAILFVNGAFFTPESIILVIVLNNILRYKNGEFAFND